MHERRMCVGELGLIFGELPFLPYYGFDIGVLRSVIAWRAWRISWVYGILSYIFSLLFFGFIIEAGTFIRIGIFICICVCMHGAASFIINYYH